MMNSRYNIFFVLIISTVLLMPFSILTINPILADNWWNNDWAYREQITIGNAGSTILTNYPAYIVVPYQVGMQTDYDDLRFTNADSTLVLDYEIEYFDATNAHIWIRIPSVAVPNVSIWMYYGNNAITSGQNPTGVWDSNHVGVWHMSETFGTVFDSTINNIDGTPFNGVNQNINGAIDGADSFNRNNS
jgi:biopolymer transport protein ExbB